DLFSNLRFSYCGAPETSGEPQDKEVWLKKLQKERFEALRRRMYTPGLDTLKVVEQFADLAVECPDYSVEILDILKKAWLAWPEVSLAGNVFRRSFWRVIGAEPAVSRLWIKNCRLAYSDHEKHSGEPKKDLWMDIIAPFLVFRPSVFTADVIHYLSILEKDQPYWNNFLFYLVTSSRADSQARDEARGLLSGEQYAAFSDKASAELFTADSKWQALVQANQEKRPVVILSPEETTHIYDSGFAGAGFLRLQKKVKTLIDRGYFIVFQLDGGNFFGFNKAAEVAPFFVRHYLDDNEQKNIAILTEDDYQYLPYFASSADYYLTYRENTSAQIKPPLLGVLRAPRVVYGFKTFMERFHGEPLAIPDIAFNERKMVERDRKVYALGKHVAGEEEFFDKTFRYKYFDAREIAVSNHTPRRVLIKRFMDEAFNRATQDPDYRSTTRLVFPQVGAEPLAEIARSMARVYGNGLEDRIHSVWGRMTNYTAMKEDFEQRVLFVKYLYDCGILDDDTRRILVVDTDSRNSQFGTEKITYISLLSEKVIAEVNERFGLDLKAWNSDTGFQVEHLYIYLPECSDEAIEKGLDSAVIDKDDYLSRMKISGFNQQDAESRLEVFGLWQAIDRLPPINTNENRFILDSEGRACPVKRPAYGQSDSGRRLEISHHLQYAGLVMGVLACLEAQGYNVEQEYEQYLKQLKYRLTHRVDQDNRLMPQFSIAGATGFLGYHLSRAVAEKGKDARLLIRAENGSGLQGISPSFDCVAGNILDLDNLASVLHGSAIFFNAAADSSTNITKDNINASAQILTVNVMGPALSMLMADEEDERKRVVFISSFDIEKVPDEADEWIEQASQKIIKFAAKYFHSPAVNDTPYDFMYELAEDLAGQEFEVNTYPLSKALMERVATGLAEVLESENIIILRTMGLAGVDMLRSSNSGL
ncbi:NAD-dependent epimerase/dehydratase family protein, partial [Candidatus Omnitrophota bacterium]